MNDIIPFTLKDRQVRVVQIDGQPWFVAADVCRALGLSNPTMAVKPLDPDEKAKSEVGCGSPANLISESGLYKLILRSDKPEARPFQDWITREVLPAIRKDGAYVAGEERFRAGEEAGDELVERVMALLQRKVARLTEERRKLEQENRALLCDAVSL